MLWFKRKHKLSRQASGPKKRSWLTVRPSLEVLEDRCLMCVAVGIAVPDYYATPKDQTLAVQSPGVLANDQVVSAAGFASLQALLVTGPEHGSLSLSGDGALIYYPDPQFVGVDTFSYRAWPDASPSPFGCLGDAVPWPYIPVATVTTVTIGVGLQDDLPSTPLSPGFTIRPSSDLITSETGQTAEFTVVLNSRPSHDVFLPLASTDTTEGRTLTSSLLFTPSNWFLPQHVTVVGIDDVLDDGDVSYTISTGPARSADPSYNGLDPADPAVMNRDDDVTTTFTSTDVPRDIPDRSTIRSSIYVPENYSIQDLDVRLDISHTYDADLDVFLISPDGIRVELFTDVGGSGDNFSGTGLDDEADTAITAGKAPFRGSYRPERSLSAYDGRSSGGNWILEITDDSRSDTGRLHQWSLTVTHRDASATASESSLLQVVLPNNEMLPMDWHFVFASYLVTSSANVEPERSPLSGASPTEYAAATDIVLSTDDSDDSDEGWLFLDEKPPADSDALLDDFFAVPEIENVALLTLELPGLEGT